MSDQLRNVVRDDEMLLFHRQNPFYSHHVFQMTDLQRERLTMAWWMRVVLWFIPTYTQVSEGYAWFYKVCRGRIYLMRAERLPTSNASAHDMMGRNRE